MADHDEEHPEAEEPSKEWDSRETAPQSPYTTRDAAIGAVVALVGLLIIFGIPLLLG